MTLSKFNNLPLEQRNETLWEWGFYIDTIKEENQTKAIFLLDDFLVEQNINPTDNSNESIKAVSLSDKIKSSISGRSKNNPLLKF